MVGVSQRCLKGHAFSHAERRQRRWAAFRPEGALKLRSRPDLHELGLKPCPSTPYLRTFLLQESIRLRPFKTTQSVGCPLALRSDLTDFR